MATITVAYTTNKKKQKHFFDALVRTSRTWIGYCGPSQTQVSVRLVPLFHSEHLNPTTPIHAVIHKRTDDMAAVVLGTDPQATKRLNALDHVLKPRHGGEPRHRLPVVSIDPLDCVWTLVDRRKISEAVDRAFGNSMSSDSDGRTTPCQKERKLPIKNVHTLPWVQIPLCDGLAAVPTAIDGNLNFPIIMKRRLACGTKPSHEMVVVHDMNAAISAAKDIFGAEEPSQSQCSAGEAHRHSTASSHDSMSDIIAQEFIANHGGVIFKVYAIDTNVVVQPRPSLQQQDKPPDRASYYFDSQKLSRGEAYSFDPATGCSKGTEAVMPSRRLALAVVSSLMAELGLSLIGVDLVYDTLTKNYHVVDINYFPGYKGVGKAHEWLLQHICNRVMDRRDER